MLDAGPESAYEEKMRVPQPPPPPPPPLTFSLRADILQCEIGFVQIGNIGISVHQEGWAWLPRGFHPSIKQLEYLQCICTLNRLHSSGITHLFVSSLFDMFGYFS